VTDDRQGLGGRQPPLPGQPLLQGLAAQQLHGEEDVQRLASGLCLPEVVDQVVHPADVGMGHPAGELDFALEPLQNALVAGDLGPQHLDRHRLAQLQVGRLVDLADRPAAEEGDDPVAGGEDLAPCQCRSGCPGGAAFLGLDH
jgi:hypothetical protein